MKLDSPGLVKMGRGRARGGKLSLTGFTALYIPPSALAVIAASLWWTLAPWLTKGKGRVKYKPPTRGKF